MLTLIANSQEWHSRSLESVLGPHGYAVLRAYTAKQTIERALSGRPDLIIVDTDLPDRSSYDLVRELLTMSELSPCTPIVMTTTGESTRQKRVEALRAGAMDFLGSSLDAEELTLKLDALTRSKRELDRVREESLLDDATGLYNLRGLARRAREVGSQAFRQKEALACLVVSPANAGQDQTATTDMLSRMARLLRHTGRQSDVIGLFGPDELAIVATGTDDAGVERFVERIAEAFATVFTDEPVALAVGYDSVPNFAEAPMDPSDMLTRAATAMRASRHRNTPSRVKVQRFSNGAPLN